MTWSACFAAVVGMYRGMVAMCACRSGFLALTASTIPHVHACMHACNTNPKAADPLLLKTSSHENQNSFSGEIPKVFNTENVNVNVNQEKTQATPLILSSEEPSRQSSKTSSHEILKASSHEDLKTLSRESLKASSHEDLKTLSRESLKASSHGSSKTSSRESLKSSSDENLAASQHETLNSPSHRSSTASSHRSSKTLSLKASSHEDLSHDSQKASIHKSSRTSSHETLKASSHGSLKEVDYVSSKVSPHKSTLTSTNENPITILPTDISQPNVKSSAVNGSAGIMKSPENTPHKVIGQAAAMMGGGDNAEGVARENTPKEKEESFTVYVPCSSEQEGTFSLPQASKEPLERELAALQVALKAAGLPQLGETFASPHTSSTDPHNKFKLETHISSGDPHNKSKLDNKESHSVISAAGKGIALSLHDAIREITTQELASVMKEVLEQERQDMGDVRADMGDVCADMGDVCAGMGDVCAGTLYTEATRAANSGWEWTPPPGHVWEGDDQGSHDLEREKPWDGHSSKNASLSIGTGTNRGLSKAGKAVRY